jgi:hypothetical protein
VTPTWLDETGRPRPHARVQVRAQSAGLPLPRRTLQLVGWLLFTVVSYTNWWGHGQEFIPVPEDDGWCWMIPVLGEAA